MENFINFLRENPFGAFCAFCIFVWGVERIAVAFIERNKPVHHDCDCNEEQEDDE